MRVHRPQNVRTRLTLWYVAVLAGALLIYGAGTSALLLYQLRSQLDHRAVEDLEAIKGLLSFGRGGELLFRSSDQDQLYPTKMLDPLVEVLAQDGTLLYRNELLANRSLGGAVRPEEISGYYTFRSLRLSDGMAIRLISREYILEGRPTLIRLGFSEESLWQRFWQVVAGLLAGFPLVLVFAGLGGYFLARHALAPVERMARRVNEINAERLSARLDIENPRDELGYLANAFNDTLSRLERSFAQLRQFTSDVSHELRTPLTAIRSVGEVGLQRQVNAEEYRDVIGSMLEESVRLTSLVDSLLTIARAEAGQLKPQRETITVLPFAREVASLLDVLAEEKKLHLSVEGEEDIQIEADGAILRQVLTNLLDNAIKYTPTGGKVSVRVSRTGDDAATIEIADTGPGIPPEHREKVFDRFYRVDDGRSRSAGGNGLGLAIAKWGAEVHGGRLELFCPESSGSVFRLTFYPASVVTANRRPESISSR